MTDQETTLYQLVAYASDMRWSGECAVPSHRRLSDFVNDHRSAALVLNNAIPAVWENGILRELAKTKTIALLKRNLLFIISKSDPPSPPVMQLERVPKEPFPAILFVPPFTLAGSIRILHNADWLTVLTSSNEDYLPVTQTSIWHIQARAKIEAEVKLVLVNRHWLLGLESKARQDF